MSTVYSVLCMLCGRLSGHVRGTRFLRAAGAPPLIDRGGRYRCGFCGGNVYLEPDDTMTRLYPGEMDETVERRAS